uniref:Spindle pole body component n=1 Tax=Panagrellus redivivus TaxID=6233 RepID=A0A7E4WD49_PANRE
MPTSPEIDDRRFIVKTDIDRIRLSDLPVSLITAARICQYLGNSGVARYSVEPKDGTSPLIFGKSLAASFQQVALNC